MASEHETEPKKKDLGQFFTKEYEYILQNMYIPIGVKHIIEPFCGNGDLLKFIKHEITIVECYDIDPKHNYISKRDTIMNPPDYNNKFVLTNPPYLARNKTSSKTMYDKYSTNDLYKCFLKELIVNKCIGGILIIPLNFWCSIRTSDIQLRSSFLEVYNVIQMNIFEERVFEDTSYTICSFQFESKKTNEKCIKTTIYPSKSNIDLVLNESNNYTIFGEIYKLPKNTNFTVSRLTKKKTETQYITKILVKCIDSTEMINASISDEVVIDDTEKSSNRTYITLFIKPILDLPKQIILVNLFNEYLNEHRQKYHSLFLSNYREHHRKRISFELVYDIMGHLIKSIN